uniref:VWA domain-containing protein n=1 Tax=Vibrio cholerae TaxID=666 RepID=UPI001C104384
HGAFFSGDNAGGVLEGGQGDDIIIADQGGTATSFQPGKNYNIALILDTSGSMDELSGGRGSKSRLKLAQEALENLA